MRPKTRAFRPDLENGNDPTVHNTFLYGKRRK